MASVRVLIDGIVERLGIRAVLLVLLGIAAGIIGAYFLTEVLSDRERAMESARAELLERALSAADRQERLITDTRVLLSQLTLPPRTTDQLIEDCQAHFPRVLTELVWLSTLAILDTNGRVLCTTSETDAALNLADRAYFQEAKATGAFTISSYLVGRATGRPMLVAAMPRVENGEVTAVVIGAIDIDWFSQIAATMDRPGAGIEVMILDVAGIVVGGSAGLGERLRGQTLPPSTIGPAEQGVIDRFPFEDRSYVAAHAGLLTTGGTIVVMQTREQVFAVVEAEAVQSLSLLALLSVFVFALVWLGGEVLVLRPMKALATTAKGLGSGDYSARATLSGFPRELMALGNAFNTMGAELQVQNQRLADQAMSDGLTGLRNKRAFNEQLEVEMKRARRERRTLCLILLDIDHFKKFNDRYGHAAGDDAIKGVAGVLAARARRGGDVAARVGGEEFALVLPDCQLEHGREIAEDVNRSVVALQIPHEDSDHHVVSVSIGVTILGGQDTARSLVERSDEALYRSKKVGRNRTEVIGVEPYLAAATENAAA